MSKARIRIEFEAEEWETIEDAAADALQAVRARLGTTRRRVRSDLYKVWESGDEYKLELWAEPIETHDELHARREAE